MYTQQFSTLVRIRFGQFNSNSASPTLFVTRHVNGQMRARHTEGVDAVCAVERNSNLQRRSSGLLLLLLLLLALTKKPTTAATAGAAKKSMNVLMSGEICVESRKATNVECGRRFGNASRVCGRVCLPCVLLVSTSRLTRSSFASMRLWQKKLNFWLNR